MNTDTDDEDDDVDVFSPYHQHALHGGRLMRQGDSQAKQAVDSMERACWLTR